LLCKVEDRLGTSIDPRSGSEATATRGARTMAAPQGRCNLCLFIY